MTVKGCWPLIIEILHSWKWQSQVFFKTFFQFTGAVENNCICWEAVGDDAKFDEERQVMFDTAHTGSMSRGLFRG